MQSLGEGANIYIISAGVNAGHADFASASGTAGSRVVAAHTVDAGSPADVDVRGEGTLAAGLAAGAAYGVAKAATVHSVKVFRDDSVEYSTPEAAVVEGLNFVAVRPSCRATPSFLRACACTAARLQHDVTGGCIRCGASTRRCLLYTSPSPRD